MRVPVLSLLAAIGLITALPAPPLHKRARLDAGGAGECRIGVLGCAPCDITHDSRQA
jgi:hypothetical protein